MTLTLEEMIEILEGIARESKNAAARIAAIKTLMEIAPPEPDTDIWKELDELAPRRTTTPLSPDGAGGELLPQPGGFEG